MPLLKDSGNVTADAYGGGVAAVPTYIEDVFSTWLTTGTGSTLIVNNGIDLAGKGGLVWQKGRNSVAGATSNTFFDTVRGVNQLLASNSTAAQVNAAGTLTSFNSNGFEIGSNNNLYLSGQTGVNWTFRKQPKFFDIVTWTGDGNAGRQISHNLGSVPGCIIVKCTSNVTDWEVYHTSLGASQVVYLNATSAAGAATGGNAYWNTTSPTSTVFTVGSSTEVNGSGRTYIAYLFAHNAGGFGLTGTDNVISCGSYTGTGAAGNSVTLGYEPQWILIKSTGSNSWYLYDSMRGVATGGGNDNYLLANVSDAEATATNRIAFNATGFTLEDLNGSDNASGQTYIYIAIRRGPMKVPTDATKVFSPNATTSTTGTAITTNFPVDLYVWQNRDGTYSNVWQDRLRGIPNTDTTGVTLTSQSTLAEQSGGYNGAYQPWNTGLRINTGASGANSIYWNFQRAPSFFDEVCYTGTGTATAFTHNLQATPELFIVKRRDSTGGWAVYSAALGNTKYLYLHSTTAALTSSAFWNNTSPTSTQFTVGTDIWANASGSTYVAYLFATCAGVSKVGSYTGNGSTQTINCGFTGGARFVLIKRTDSTGDWYVYDTARGMTTLTDPYLLLNSTAAESATLGSVTTVSTGFAVNASILAAINTNAASYIFLAIA